MKNSHLLSSSRDDKEGSRRSLATTSSFCWRRLPILNCLLSDACLVILGIVLKIVGAMTAHTQSLGTMSPSHRAQGSQLHAIDAEPRSVLHIKGGSAKVVPVSQGVAVPVYLMLPLDTVDSTTMQLNETIEELLKGAVDVGAAGVMFDLWWGLCEQEPSRYKFDGYIHLMHRCKALGLKVQAVMSFHACGGNVGDNINIPLPQWVLNLEKSVPQLFYMDQRGDASKEYVSLSCDDTPVFPRGDKTKEGPGRGKGEESNALRTAIEIYTDFMRAFRDASKELIDAGTLVEIQVGCGPCGELRYPSYPLTPRKHFPTGWAWPGLGEIQCYDQGMLASLSAAQGRTSPPRNMGCYNDFPEECAFWRELPGSRPLKLPDGWCGLGGHTTFLGRFLHNTFFRVFRQGSPKLEENKYTDTEYMPLVRRVVFRVKSAPRFVSLQKPPVQGAPPPPPEREAQNRQAWEGESCHFGTGREFLEWYRDELILHGERVTNAARQIFGPQMHLACKVSGIHWLRGHESHAAEATAGYVGNYLYRVAKMLAKTNSILDFTCLEMTDATQAWWALSRPQGLVLEAAAAARSAGIEFAGENALACWESEAEIEQIEATCARVLELRTRMSGFTALRLERALIAPGSQQRRSLERFIANMQQLTSARTASRTLAEKLCIALTRAYRTFNAFKAN